ncbi:hypothetical protein [Nonomuraea sp. NPDC049758]
MHWHAYLWTGNGAERGREAERRPGSPDFPTSSSNRPAPGSSRSA